MCGIFGCIGKLDRRKAEMCINRIKHRGPDALGIEELQGATLAHARLSILDISDVANQPFCSMDRRYWIIFNGEIYNFIELRKELELFGYQFRSQSDTEVVLYAYLHWGEAFQKKCNGMWALAIWDDYEKSLFLSRDRFGVKPLFMFENKGNFYFASEMKAFFPVMDERKTNLKFFNPLDPFALEMEEETAIQGIKRFPAGHCAIYNKNSHLQVKRWWFTLDNLTEIPESYEEQVKYLKELFLDAVKIRMRSDVPIGTALSGGIDSSTVVGVMHHLSKLENGQHFCKEWQHAFVASMEETMLDETEYAQTAATHAGIEITKVLITPPISERELLYNLYMVEEPYDSALVAQFQEYRAIGESGIKVTVDGFGSDELFCGYESAILDSIRMGGYSEEELKDIVDIYNDMVWKEDRISFEDAKELRRCQDRNLYKINSVCWDKLDVLNKVLYWQTHQNILPSILRNSDRHAMASGVEIRMPFLDHRIVSFAFSLPWTSKLRNGYAKAIVRDMASPYMDHRILSRKIKIGFNDPCTEWFKGPMKEWLLDVIHSRDFYECGLINSLEVTVYVNEALQGEDNGYLVGHRIWPMIAPYLWQKAVVELGGDI